MPGGVKGGSQKVVRSLQEAIRCLPGADRGPVQRAVSSEQCAVCSVQRAVLYLSLTGTAVTLL